MTQNTLLSPLDFWNRTRTLGTTGTFGAKPGVDPFEVSIGLLVQNAPQYPMKAGTL